MLPTVGSLFSGIGGFDLGFERAGFRVAWQVEINEYCQRVLAKHWPDVPRHDDVRTFPPTRPEDWRCDVIAGGFPCQDLSRAGARAGITGPRSGLWSEFARIVRLVRPHFVVLENVAAITDGGLGRVLGDLAAVGYDAEWDCLPACAFGAHHIRDRFFLVGRQVSVAGVLHADGERRREFDATDLSAAPRILGWTTPPGGLRGWNRQSGLEPVVDRMVHGLPRRVDRLRGLGNAVVPEVAEWIARQLLPHLSEPVT